jgi:LemA protein
MSVPLAIWFLLALTLFWSVGLHNRVMRLRARAVTHLAEIELLMQQCVGLLQPNMDECKEDDGVLREVPKDRLEQESVLSSLEAFFEDKSDPFGARKMMLLDELALGLRACQSQSNASQLNCCGQPDPEALTHPWESHSDELRARITELHLVLSQYNEAISQIPAKWVAALFGFELALVGL